MHHYFSMIPAIRTLQKMINIAHLCFEAKGANEQLATFEAPSHFRISLIHMTSWPLLTAIFRNRSKVQLKI